MLISLRPVSWVRGQVPTSTRLSRSKKPMAWESRLEEVAPAIAELAGGGRERVVIEVGGGREQPAGRLAQRHQQVAVREVQLAGAKSASLELVWLSYLTAKTWMSSIQPFNPAFFSP